MKPGPAARRPVCAGALLALAAALAGCGGLPQGRPNASHAYTDTADTRLGRAFAPGSQAHAGLSGIVPLQSGVDAFAARAGLANAVERSLDVQHYIWRHDLSGVLLADTLRSAAERGVRVRLLLDDNNTQGLDPLLLALDAQANIEVRLFNPHVHRRSRLLGLFTDFPRLNRRMHNKAFIFDNQAAIVGGRNVGDEYFDASPGLSFVDLDLLLTGPVVAEISQDFDRYWNSEAAFPLAALVAGGAPDAPLDLPARAQELRSTPEARVYGAALRDTTLVRRLIDGQLPDLWAPARLVSDDPAKVLGHGRREDFVLPRLRQVLGRPRQELLLVTPYFVPTRAGTQALATLVADGVRVAVLTNALEATDVAVVHAGYAKWRSELLRAGVQLYEMKRAALVSGAPRPRWPGSSASSLHAKTFMVDRQRLFVGSFNFDPRSASLNTEMGVVIESPEIADALARGFADALRAMAYEVRLDERGDLVWLDHGTASARVLPHEPGTGPFQRAWIDLLTLLPIEWLL